MKRKDEYRIVYRGEGYMPQVRGGWWPFWRDLCGSEVWNELEAECWIRLIAEVDARRQRKGVVKRVEVSE